MKKYSYNRKPELSSGFRSLLSLLFITSILFLSGCQPAPVEPTVIPQEPPTLMNENVEPTEPEPEQADPTPAYPTIPELPFYLGVDLSYVNEMDDCGAIYLDNGEPKDAYQLFASHSAKLVRVRLWHNPDWTDYSDLNDIKRTLTRSKEAGMATILDFHYSDNWADPGKQAIPAAWKELSEEELIQAVYDYTYQTLFELSELGLMPEFVQVGNETNSGLLKDVMDLDWTRDAKLFNAGIKAVRDVAADTNTNPQIILHVAQPENAGWWFNEATTNGILDFDVIGLSYYPQWSSFSISDLGGHVSYLRNLYGKDVMIVETAYPWTTEAVDETASNILYQGVREYPISIEGQRQFMIDLSQALISNGAKGVVYWEPAWVSTQCSTRWGQGSHWENATFFDFNNNNELHQGVEFLSFPYNYPKIIVDGIIDENYANPILEDEVNDNFESVPHLDLVSLHVAENDEYLSLAITIQGDIFEDPWGSYMLYVDTTDDETGADVEVGRRPINTKEPYNPEYRLDIQALDRKGTVSGTFVMNVWNELEWTTHSITFGIAIKNGEPSVIEMQIPKAELGDPDFVNLAVITTGRGRIHTASDIMGTPISPQDWSEPIILDQFTRFNLTK